VDDASLPPIAGKDFNATTLADREMLAPIAEDREEDRDQGKDERFSGATAAD
jgi:hypothetical protein